MRAEGWLCAITEHWNPFAKIRQDLFGFIDVLAIRGNEMVAIQTTTGEHVSARIGKIRESSAAAVWLLSPSRRLIVHGWAKRGERGKAKHWTCRQVEVMESSEREIA